MVEITNEERSALGDALAQLVGRAWADESFKAELIAEPETASAKLDVALPEGLRVEFYDDPAANLGDWSRASEGASETLRVPIPARPGAAAASTTELAGVSGGVKVDDIVEGANTLGDVADTAMDVAEIIEACCCCGAASQDTDDWY